MENTQKIAIAGLAFGDEGKGTIAECLTWRYDAEHIVRYNGGPQAAHFVVTPQGIEHCFSQFGSGTFAGARTFLSGKMLIDPIRMKNEAIALEKKGVNESLKRVVIDPDCFIITPFHGIINQMLEISRGEARHGSCGVGVGQAVKDSKQLGEMALIAKDMLNKETLWRKLDFLWRVKIDLAQQLVAEHPNMPELNKRLEKLIQENYVQRLVSFYCNFVTESGVQIRNDKQSVLESDSNIIFEGAQGVLLDPKYGFTPYITKTKTTFKNVEDLLNGRVPRSEIKKIGVLRAYSTRHGAGPFVTENDWLGRQIPDYHNGANEWQGKFRIGWFDLLTARYGTMINRDIDSIALTNLDRLSRIEEIPICTSYEYTGKNEELLSNFFEWEYFGSRIRITGFKKPNKPVNEQLAKILFDCKPMEFQKFQGWKEDISKVKKIEDLPIEARKYIDFLQSEKGLNVPISIVSVGPKSDQKIFL
ncbi:adenylosuccinate synthetase [Candidatus Parcubacteria bacterium]|nr:adenylosuccinate synthetase [Candidatus Parcubacteria bacterium]